MFSSGKEKVWAGLNLVGWRGQKWINQETNWPSCNPRTHTRAGLSLGLPFNILHFTNDYVSDDVLGTDDTKIRNKQNLSKSLMGPEFPAYQSQPHWLGLRCQDSPSQTGTVFAVEATQIKHPWLPLLSLLASPLGCLCISYRALPFCWQKKPVNKTQVGSAQHRVKQDDHFPWSRPSTFTNDFWVHFPFLGTFVTLKHTDR